MAINYLEQKRLIFSRKQSQGKGDNFGNTIKKIPSYIQTNGFLYTMAFLAEKSKKDKDFKAIFNAICEWHTLSELNEQRLMDKIEESNFLEELLTQKDDIIRAMTMETLSLMKCFRRFVKEED